MVFDRPFVSVVMPVRNERAYIERCLNNILLQDYPKDSFEIIVADGQSTDGTREIIEKFKNKHGNLKLIDNLGKIVSPGLNSIMKIAGGSIIVRVDGHCEIAPDYIRNAVMLLEEYPEAAGVGGPIETIGQDWISKSVAIAMSSKFGVGGSAFRTIKDKERYVDTIAFPAYRREIIEKAGSYDEELVRNQDDEYNYRLRKMGFKLLLSPKMKSCYYSRSSISKLFSQYFQYGFWKVRVLQKHPKQMLPRQFAPFLFIFFLLVFICFSAVSSSAKSALIFLLIVYGSVNLLVSLVESAKAGWSFLIILPLIYSALHFGYGLGFSVGLGKFWNRWNLNESKESSNKT